jgi:hypothetical protein
MVDEADFLKSTRQISSSQGRVREAPRRPVNAVAAGASTLKNEPMSELDETQAIDQVINRLAERFPSLERDHIAEVVNEELHELDGGRVRDFVPVLVEKASKKRLKKEVKATTAVVEQGDELAPLLAGNPAPDPLEVERASREGHRGAPAG